MDDRIIFYQEVKVVKDSSGKYLGKRGGSEENGIFAITC